MQILDQNLYDVDKTVNWVHSKYGNDIDLAILGDLGGRVDHGLRQVHYLYLLQPGPAYPHGRVFLVTSQNLTILLKAGFHQIWLRGECDNIIGDNMGIIPIGGPSTITTKGLVHDVKQLEIMLGRIIHRSKIMPGISMIEITTSNPVLFTIDSFPSH